MMLVKFQTNSRGRQMPLTITDASMTSDLTTHTAKQWPWNGEPAWSVTWLPGRVLTHNQAITAMTIAEIAADTPGQLTGPWVTHVDGWAAELGITGPEAIAAASKPWTGRNSRAEVCPSWCTQDHTQLILPDKPEFGLMNNHQSDPVRKTTRKLPVMVKLYQVSGAGAGAPMIIVRHDYGTAELELTAKDARALAVLLGTEHPSALADDILAAVEMMAAISVRAQK